MKTARPAILVATLCAAALFAAQARADGPWTGGGTGTTTVVADGTTGAPAQFTYSANPAHSGSWNFSTTAGGNETVVLGYSYSGYHAFFQVRVSLSVFVTHNGSTTSTTLVNAGPVNCCSSPSGGFSYTGTVSLVVQAGDTYGFTMTGSNSDSDARLLGTLTVTDQTPRPDRAGYCAAAGDTSGLTNAPIPAGAFLDLIWGQPDTDAHYAGATLAIFVAGDGITCDAPPAGYVESGSFGPYAYYTAPGSS